MDICFEGLYEACKKRFYYAEDAGNYVSDTMRYKFDIDQRMKELVEAECEDTPIPVFMEGDWGPDPDPNVPEPTDEQVLADVCDGICRQLRREFSRHVEAAALARINREQAQTIATLLEDGFLRRADFSATTAAWYDSAARFTEGWNKHHPDEEPVTYRFEY